MSKLKINIVNPSTDFICVIGRHSFRIPEQGKLDIELPNDEKVKAMLSRLNREYPVLKITKEVVGGEAAPTTKKVEEHQAKGSKETIKPKANASHTEGK